MKVIITPKRLIGPIVILAIIVYIVYNVVVTRNNVYFKNKFIFDVYQPYSNDIEFPNWKFASYLYFPDRNPMQFFYQGDSSVVIYKIETSKSIVYEKLNYTETGNQFDFKNDKVKGSTATIKDSLNVNDQYSLYFEGAENVDFGYNRTINLPPSNSIVLYRNGEFDIILAPLGTPTGSNILLKNVGTSIYLIYTVWY